MTKFSGRIFGTSVLLSPELRILGGKLFPDPSVTKAPETGYSELVLVQISLRLTLGLPCSVCAITETDGVITLDGLDDVLASRLDSGLPIPLTMEVSLHCMSQASKYLRGSVQTEGKYSELIYLVFEGKM